MNGLTIGSRLGHRAKEAETDQDGRHLCGDGSSRRRLFIVHDGYWIYLSISVYYILVGRQGEKKEMRKISKMAFCCTWRYWIIMYILAWKFMTWNVSAFLTKYARWLAGYYTNSCAVFLLGNNGQKDSGRSTHTTHGEKKEKFILPHQVHKSL